MDFMPMAALNGELSPIAGVVSISIVADLLTQISAASPSSVKTMSAASNSRISAGYESNWTTGMVRTLSGRIFEECPKEDDGNRRLRMADSGERPINPNG
jgi:hypothetical protein